MNVAHFVYPFERCLDCFQFLIVMDEAVINIPIQDLYEHKFSFLLGKYLLDYMIGLCLTFKNLPNGFPEWLWHFAFPPIMSAFQLLRILGFLFVFLAILIGVHLSHCAFSLCFPNG